MKLRILAAIAAVSLLCGCNLNIGKAADTIPELNKSYCFNAEMKYDGFTSKAEFCRSDENLWTITLLEPYALEGLTLSYQNGKLTASMGGFDLTDSGTFSTIAQEVTDIIESVIDNEGVSLESSSDSYTASGMSGDSGYKLSFDKDGSFTTLTTPKLEVTFENVSGEPIAKSDIASIE